MSEKEEDAISDKPIEDDGIVRIGPLQYVHILNTNTNLTLPVQGPLNMIQLDHQKIITGPIDMIQLKPNTCCVIIDPVVKAKDGTIEKDFYGKDLFEYKIARKTEEIRYYEDYKDPFIIYPGEQFDEVLEYCILGPTDGLQLSSSMDHLDNGIMRKLGDHWLFCGPGVYRPRIDEDIEEEVKSIIVLPNQALRLQATIGFTDRHGKARVSGEEYLMTTPGQYFLDFYEKLLKVESGYILDPYTGIYIKAIESFNDNGTQRRMNDMWLVTKANTECYFLSTKEKYVGPTKLVTLNELQYCVIFNPCINGVTKYKKKITIRGPKSFFLNPYESIVEHIKDAFVLKEDDAVLMEALANFEDIDGAKRTGGKRWIVRGPKVYMPHEKAKLIEKRKAIALDKTEGVYVRNLINGEVRCVIGEKFMLEAYEQLWEKELPAVIEKIIFNKAKRNKTKAVIVKVDPNNAMQLYDYKSKKEQIIMGPTNAILNPYEEITILYVPNGATNEDAEVGDPSITIRLGPEYAVSKILVETLEHAKINLTLSYEWRFNVEKGKEEIMFLYKNYIGSACKRMACCIRSIASRKLFEEFHRNASDLITREIFKITDTNKTATPYRMENGLEISKIDIQQIETANQDMKESLENLVTQSIEITAKSQEERGKELEELLALQHSNKEALYSIKNRTELETYNIALETSKFKSLEIETKGKAMAEQEEIETRKIMQAQGAVEVTKLTEEAKRYTEEAELRSNIMQYDADKMISEEMGNLEIRQLGKLEEAKANKFQEIMKSLDPALIVALGKASPQWQNMIMNMIGLNSKALEISPFDVNQFAEKLISK